MAHHVQVELVADELSGRPGRVEGVLREDVAVPTAPRDAAADGGAGTVALWVADGNDRARRCYERLGFVPTGVRQPLPSDPAVGEELLRRSLRP